MTPREARGPWAPLVSGCCRSPAVCLSAAGWAAAIAWLAAPGALGAQTTPDVYAGLPSATSPSNVLAQGVVGPGDRDRRARVAVRVGDVAVTVGEIEDHLWSSPASERARYRSDEGRAEILRRLARRHLLAREAERRGVMSEAIRYEARRREEIVLVDLLELSVRAAAVGQAEAPPSTPPEAIPEERFAVVLRTRSREDAVRFAAESVGGSFDRVLARAEELGTGEQSAWMRAEGDVRFDPQLREVLFTLPEVGAASGPIELPGGELAVVFMAGRTGGYVPPTPEPSVLAYERGSEALAALTERALAEHVRDVHVERIDGVAFRMPAERSREAMERIERERPALPTAPGATE